MKKFLAYTFAILSIALTSCQNDIQDQLNGQDGKVTFTLGFTAPDAKMVTRALGETVDLETNGLWVLVYESGYKVEVVKAEEITESSAGSGQYTCKLTLSVSEKQRNLHFISMAGFTKDDAPYEETRLGSLTSANGLDAYWQIRTVSSIPYNETGSASWARFKDELGTITLIRNFAKVTMSVKSGVKFQLESFKMFRTPDKGYVAAYIPTDSEGFVSGYDALEYSGDPTASPAVIGAIDVYPGRMPDDCTLSGYTTDDADGKSFYTPDQAQYFYERPVPKENPAFIIVKGKFDSDNDGSYEDETSSYYKINLQNADGKYYALLRGFRFKVGIEMVTSVGYGSVYDAYTSSGSGNISTTLEYVSINNISDNNCRLFVNETSFTTVKAGTIVIKYKFCPDATNTSAEAVANGLIDVDDNGTTNGVEITVNAPETGIQPSIANNSESEPDVTVNTAIDSEGWSTITVQTCEPANLYKEQTITIRGRGTNEVDGENLTTIIQREIHIIVRPTLALYVEMTQPTGQTYTDEVPFGAEKDVWINVWMEDELPESIFPINLKIEAGSLTLTPALGEQLPVQSGQSASTTTPKPAFYFVKTVDYDSYLAAATSDVAISADVTKKMHKFVCKFKTNTNESATDIYVSNDLFNTAKTGFTNPTSLSLTPVAPGNWSTTATGEPYAGQTFTATLKATVPAGTTITGTTTVGGSSTNVTASISGTLLTITRTGMSYSTSGFKDLTVSTILSTGSFNFSQEVVVWTAPSTSIGTTAITNISSLTNNDYIAIRHDTNYYVYDNGSTGGNSVKLSTLPNPLSSSYIWQIKDMSGSTFKLLNYGTGKYIETRSSGTTGQTTNTTSTSSNYATLAITYNSSYSSWQFKLSNQTLYFNDWGDTNANIGWWNEGTYNIGSRFQIYKCNITPATRPTK